MNEQVLKETSKNGGMKRKGLAKGGKLNGKTPSGKVEDLEVDLFSDSKSDLTSVSEISLLISSVDLTSPSDLTSTSTSS